MLTTADRYLRTQHSPQRNSSLDELTFVRAPVGPVLKPNMGLARCTLAVVRTLRPASCRILSTPS